MSIAVPVPIAILTLGSVPAFVTETSNVGVLSSPVWLFLKGETISICGSSTTITGKSIVEE